MRFWKMKQLADDEKGHPRLSNVLSPSEVRYRRRVNCFGIYLFPSSCDLTCHTLGNLPFKTGMSCFFHSPGFSKLLGVAVESSSRNVPVSSHHVSRECIVYIHSHNINPSLFEPHAGLPRCGHLATQKWFCVLGSGFGAERDLGGYFKLLFSESRGTCFSLNGGFQKFSGIEPVSIVTVRVICKGTG